MNRSIRVLLILVAILLVVAMAGCSGYGSSSGGTKAPAGGGAAPAAAGASVAIRNFAFDPADLTVKVGDTVTFTNDDSVAHTVTFESFDSGNVDAGGTYSHKFDTAGKFPYHCSIHPQMTGTITVQ